MGARSLARSFVAVVLMGCIGGCTLNVNTDDKDKKSSRDDDDDRSKKRKEREDEEPVLSKAEQCNKVIETVNASKLGDSVGNDKAKLLTESDRATKLEEDLGKQKISDGDLKKLVTDYRGNLLDYAAMMKKAAKVDDNDLDGLMKLVKQASDVAAKNSELTKKLSDYCTK